MLGTRVEHVGGDMFEEIPKADAMFMKWILHDWSDEQCLKVLDKCYRALPSKGKVVAVDVILQAEEAVTSDLEARVGYHTDLLMFAYNEGGKERTLAELHHLASASGFASIQPICTVHGNTILEFYKA